MDVFITNNMKLISLKNNDMNNSLYICINKYDVEKSTVLCQNLLWINWNNSLYFKLYFNENDSNYLMKKTIMNLESKIFQTNNSSSVYWKSYNNGDILFEKKSWWLCVSKKQALDIFNYCGDMMKPCFLYFNNNFWLKLMNKDDVKINELNYVVVELEANLEKDKLFIKKSKEEYFEWYLSGET